MWDVHFPLHAVLRGGRGRPLVTKLYRQNSGPARRRSCKTDCKFEGDLYMRKLLLVVAILMIPVSSLLAQDEPWRNRPGRYGRYTGDNFFELMPFVGYRYGGTIFADQTNLFNHDVTVESAANFGANFAIPVANGLKVELLVDRQNTHFTNGAGGLFAPNDRLGAFDITYFQGGLLVPFAVSRQATPYFVVGAGIANLDPRVSGASSDTRFSANAGIGVKVPLSRNVGIRLEERGYFTSMSNSNNNCRACYYNYNHDLYQGETNVGVFFRF
jgi:opacity protein-like surface antigen